MRGIVDRKGEQFAYVQGKTVFTLDGEATGEIVGEFIVDLVGNRRWRLVGDGIYALDGSETIGYLSSERPSPYDL
jgi:hypothetical protein